MTIMSGRMGEDTEALRRNWPFPDPPLKCYVNKYGDLITEDEEGFIYNNGEPVCFPPIDGGFSIHKLDNLTPDVNQEFNPIEYEQMK